jgi:hypothetical protein
MQTCPTRWALSRVVVVVSSHAWGGDLSHCNLQGQQAPWEGGGDCRIVEPQCRAVITELHGARALVLMRLSLAQRTAPNFYDAVGVQQMQLLGVQTRLVMLGVGGGLGCLRAAGDAGDVRGTDAGVGWPSSLHP